MNAENLKIKIAGRDDTLDAVVFANLLRKTLAGLADLPRADSKPQFWAMVRLSMHSPALVEVSPRTEGRHEARMWIQGLRLIEQRGIAPVGWGTVQVNRVRELGRLLAGQVGEVTYSTDGESFSPTAKIIEAADRLLGREQEGHRIKTTLEGKLDEVNLHGATPKFQIFDPISDVPIACEFDTEDLETVKSYLAHRVAVTGLATFDRLGHPTSIEVDSFQRLPMSREVHLAERMRKLDISGGMDSVDYILRVRNVD